MGWTQCSEIGVCLLNKGNIRLQTLFGTLKSFHISPLVKLVLKCSWDIERESMNLLT